MRIGRSLYDEMLVHAQNDAPDECCGLLAYRDGIPVQVFATANAAASPLKFVIDPPELFAAYTAIEDAGLELGAIYHSHTRSEPYPSQTDINFAKGWPGVQWLIFGLAGETPHARMYDITDGRVTETELTLTDTGKVGG